MISKIFNFIPGAYFFQSRIKDLTTFIFHFYYEWLASILILYIYTSSDLTSSISYFLTGYFMFIAVYEIGYLVNDHISTRSEANPRRKLELEKGHGWLFWAWVIIRIVIFVFLYHTLDTGLEHLWATLVMLAIFMAHNFIKNDQLKCLTFFNLALFRFILPVLPFIPTSLISDLALAVVINYVLYRTINYMDSKDLLHFKDKKAPWFKVSFYLLLAPACLLPYWLDKNTLPLTLNVYYLFFWCTYMIRSVLGGFSK